MPPPRCSLVIPFYQEAGNVASVVPAACAELATIDPDFEAILVNDGSTDGTGTELTQIASTDAHCRIIALPKNRGQATALLAGLQQARGEIIFTMDGDGQNDPRDFPALLALLSQGVDVACGWRKDRHDSLLRRVM